MAKTSKKKPTDLEPRPWYALGLGAGLLTALLLSIGEYVRLTMLGDGPLEGPGDALRFVATSLTVYGFITVPLGLGFGLALSGLARWLDLPDSWHRLVMDSEYRRAHETNLAALAVTIPLGMLAVAGLAFFLQTSFVRHMNNPTLSGAFMALGVLVGLAAGLGLMGVGVVLFRGLLPALGLRWLVRREPRLLRGTLWLVGGGAALALVGGFIALYNPEVWPLEWVVFFVLTLVLPLGLTLSGPLIGWAKVLRSPALAAMTLVAYMALSAWTFTGLGDWDGPRQAVLDDTAFAPTLAGLVHTVTDMDGDGQSRLLGGADCDDGNASVFAGATEIPGNGLDDNCLGGDAPLRSGEGDETTSQPTALGTGQGRPGEGSGSGLAATPEPPPPPPRHNIVLLLIDTLRPDHLGYFGYTRTPLEGVERTMSPRIDQLARESVVFTRAYAQSNRTPGSIPSLVFGRYMSDLDLDNPTHNYPDVRDSNVSLFEVLDEHGYYTLGVASHYYFDRAPGMQQGFDEFDNRGSLSISDTNTAISAPEIFAKLEEHLPTLVEQTERGEPWALFVHYYEPHSRWLAHPDVVDFGRADSGRQRHIDRYDSEIAFVDQYIGQTLDLLAAHGLDEDTVIVLTSDHGEAFNEHGHYFHGQTLYEEVVRVPVFIRLPGDTDAAAEPRHLEVTTPVALLDLAPTLAELVGAPVPTSFQGDSWLGSERSLGSDVTQRDVFSELLPYSNWDEHIVALVRGDLKLHFHVTQRRFELYDLGGDPGEQDDLHGDHPDGDALEQRLVGWLEGDR